MQKLPKVSVLMPAYNSEKYIAEAIESILAQTFTDFELVLINDGSTDKTAEIVRQFAQKDARIRFIDNNENRGLIAVLNMGLDLCNGEYIARMDSDDISMPDRLERQVNYLDAHPNVGVLGGQREIFGTVTHMPLQTSYPTHVDSLALLFNGCLLSHPSVMIRTKVLRDAKLHYDKNYVHTEDYALWSKLVQHTHIRNLPEPALVKYRWHDENISVLYSKVQKTNTRRIMDEILASVIPSELQRQTILRTITPGNHWFHLFGFIPIILRIQGWESVKYRLFGIIPLVRIKYGWARLFEIIPICTTK